MKFNVGDVVEYVPDGTTAKIIGISEYYDYYYVSLYQGEVESKLGEGALREKCKHHDGVYHDEKEEWVCPFCEI